MKAVEIQNFARATLLQLPPALRREIGVRLFAIAAGNTQDLVAYGGGVYSFRVADAITEYVEDQTDRVVVFHIVR
ncbi:MAG TPA: hypothetical protein VNN62_22000 [Methylomirabilota bacterium]|nr:hypothetical protein [Methylomirabilota bacterium]